MNADLSRHDAWQHDPPPATVPGVEVLRLLVADAADRAAVILAGNYPAVEADDLLADGSLVSLVDAVRILATALGASHIAQAARLTGRPEEELRRLVLAYRHGGPGGVSATVEPSAGRPEQMEDAEREVLSPSPTWTSPRASSPTLEPASRSAWDPTNAGIRLPPGRTAGGRRPARPTPPVLPTRRRCGPSLVGARGPDFG